MWFPVFLFYQTRLDNSFYIRMVNLTFLLYFQEKIVLSIADAFKNIHFLLRFHWFSQWMRCAIFQINTNLLII